MKPLADCRLYTFVDTHYLNGRDPADLARQLCDGGADLVQLRAKDWAPARIEPLAALLAPICAEAGVYLVINDHPAIARNVGAPLAHLGQEDLAENTDASKRFGPDGSDPIRLGVSTHAPADVDRALAAGAAYVAVGPVYPTPTKPGRPSVGTEYVKWAQQNITAVPWFAIGGIHLANLDEVLEAGATRICVVSAILNADDVVRACREFRRRLP